MASLPAPRRRPATVVSAATARPGARKSLASFPHARRANCAEPQFPPSFRVRQVMDETVQGRGMANGLVSGATTVPGCEGGQDATHGLLPPPPPPDSYPVQTAAARWHGRCVESPTRNEAPPPPSSLPSSCPTPGGAESGMGVPGGSEARSQPAGAPSLGGAQGCILMRRLHLGAFTDSRGVRSSKVWAHALNPKR